MDEEGNWKTESDCLDFFNWYEKEYEQVCEIVEKSPNKISAIVVDTILKYKQFEEGSWGVFLSAGIGDKEHIKDLSNYFYKSKEECINNTEKFAIERFYQFKVLDEGKEFSIKLFQKLFNFHKQGDIWQLEELSTVKEDYHEEI